MTPAYPTRPGREQVGCAAQLAALRRRGGAFTTTGTSCRSAVLLGNRPHDDRQPSRSRGAAPPGEGCHAARRFPLAAPSGGGCNAITETLAKKPTRQHLPKRKRLTAAARHPQGGHT